MGFITKFIFNVNNIVIVKKCGILLKIFLKNITKCLKNILQFILFIYFIRYIHFILLRHTKWNAKVCIHERNKKSNFKIILKPENTIYEFFNEVLRKIYCSLLHISFFGYGYEVRSLFEFTPLLQYWIIKYS